jgi:hypothetical protein
MLTRLYSRKTVITAQTAAELPDMSVVTKEYEKNRDETKRKTIP